MWQHQPVSQPAKQTHLQRMMAKWQRKQVEEEEDKDRKSQHTKQRVHKTKIKKTQHARNNERKQIQQLQLHLILNWIRAEKNMHKVKRQMKQQAYRIASFYLKMQLQVRSWISNVFHGNTVGLVWYRKYIGVLFACYSIILSHLYTLAISILRCFAWISLVLILFARFVFVHYPSARPTICTFDCTAAHSTLHIDEKRNGLFWKTNKAVYMPIFFFGW